MLTTAQLGNNQQPPTMRRPTSVGPCRLRQKHWRIRARDEEKGENVNLNYEKCLVIDPREDFLGLM